MVIKNINLETVCGITSTLPENDKPEVAFAGKSNVGKSSLINALMNRKSYARISATPGKTQTINFYNINDEMYLVDLPGYGYARVSEKEKEHCLDRFRETTQTTTCLFSRFIQILCKISIEIFVQIVIQIVHNKIVLSKIFSIVRFCVKPNIYVDFRKFSNASM